ALLHPAGVDEGLRLLVQVQVLGGDARAFGRHPLEIDAVRASADRRHPHAGVLADRDRRDLLRRTALVEVHLRGGAQEGARGAALVGAAGDVVDMLVPLVHRGQAHVLAAAHAGDGEQLRVALVLEVAAELRQLADWLPRVEGWVDVVASLVADRARRWVVQGRRGDAAPAGERHDSGPADHAVPQHGVLPRPRPDGVRDDGGLRIGEAGALETPG